MAKRITFSASEYEGNEEDVFRVVNRNRSILHTEEYLSWRYGGKAKSTQIFWVCEGDGQRVGMAGLVARRYWINKELSRIWVLGDICLDKHLRGRGIGREFFCYLNSFIAESEYQVALVMPNKRAAKSLLSSGWSSPRPFSWFVWLVDPVSKLLPVVRNKHISTWVGRLYCRIMLRKIEEDIDKGFRLVRSNCFDSSFDRLWRQLPKEGLIARDRGSACLHWRFVQHPRGDFGIRKLIKADELLGYLVYSMEIGRICRIVDFCTREPVLLESMLRMFLKELNDRGDTKVVRIKLNSDHGYAEHLRTTGFVERREGDIYQIYDGSRRGMLESYGWFLTITDKDA